MKRPRTRLCDRRHSARRRSGIPGRRFALALALALVVSACLAQAAVADPTVVTATVYPGAGGSIATRSVTLSTLVSGCPAYTGSSPIYLYPSGQPYQPAAGSSWALSTVLQCGLQLTPSGITSVQVYAQPPSSQGFEASLSNAQLSDPTQFHDPQAPTALPLISHDGVENQNTYTRPWLGGSDNNTSDKVTEAGPIALVVYENGPPLGVSATAQIVSQTATAMNVRFSATVQDAAGTPVPASALTWSWSFGDGGTSTDMAPTHPFALGSYFVTVQVSDASPGTGGTATIAVSSHTSNTPTGNPQSGAGRAKKAHSPTGAEHSRGTHTGGHAGTRGAAKPDATGKSHASKGATTGTGGSGDHTTPTTSPTTPATSRTTPATGPTTPTTGPTASTAPAAGTTTPAAPAGGGTSGARTNRSATRRRHRAPPSGRRPVRRPPTPVTGSSAEGPIVVGRLIGDVTRLPPRASPLRRAAQGPPATAPAVRRAVRGSSLSAIAASLAIVLLLGLGAGRELRWRRGWRTLRVGT